MEILIVLIFLALIVLVLAANWKIYVKMGEAGWKSLIPYYNTYVLYSHIWTEKVAIASIICSIVSMFFAPVAIASMVIGIIGLYKQSLAFGKGVGYVFGMLFLPFIFIPMLGFGDAQYQGD